MYSLRLALSSEETTEISLRESLTIGRHSLCGLQLAYSFISRWHCVLIAMPPDDQSDRPYFVVKDGEVSGKPSQNGTWVNGDRVHLHRLHHQDIITFSQLSIYPRAEFWDEHATVMAASDTSGYELIQA